MTQDEITRMALEAGAVERYFGNQLHGIAFHKKEWLERFAAIVAASRDAWWIEQMQGEEDRVRADEREACAKLVETTHAQGLQSIREACAAAIRARGE